MSKFYLTFQYTENKPDIVVTTDHRGQILEIGSKVAYNRSGEVQLGVVKSFETVWNKRGNTNGKKNNWIMTFTMKVENKDDGKISTIHNPRAFVII